MQNKLIPGVLIGAVVGGAVALIDKNTRASLKNQVQNIKSGESTGQGSKISQLADEFKYWKNTVEEIRRNNPELERSLRDAKETFQQRKNNR